MKRTIIKEININESEIERGSILILSADYETSVLNVSFKNSSNLTVKTKLYQLNACKKITMVQTVFDQQTLIKVYTTPNYLKVSYKLYTDAGEYYYDGSNWVIATTQWSTEQEVCENISKFILPDNKKIGFILKVEKDVGYTGNGNISITSIKLLCDCNLNHVEDYLYKTFCDKVEKECFGQSRFIVDNFIGSKIEFQSILENNLKAYKNAEPIEVYNLSQDPKELNNIFGSYNKSTGICQLTTSITVNSKVAIYFKYNPTVQVTKSVDYYELSALPCITVFNFQEVIEYYGHRFGNYIFNNATGEGFSSYDPKIITYQFQALLDAKSNYDYLYLKEGFQKWLRENILLRTWGLDEEYDMIQTIGFNESTNPNINDIRHGVIRIEIKNVVFYDLDSYQEFSIKEINFDLNNKFDLEE